MHKINFVFLPKPLMRSNITDYTNDNNSIIILLINIIDEQIIDIIGKSETAFIIDIIDKYENIHKKTKSELHVTRQHPTCVMATFLY